MTDIDIHEYPLIIAIQRIYLTSKNLMNLKTAANKQAFIQGYLILLGIDLKTLEDWIFT